MPKPLPATTAAARSRTLAPMLAPMLALVLTLSWAAGCGGGEASTDPTAPPDPAQGVDDAQDAATADMGGDGAADAAADAAADTAADTAPDATEDAASDVAEDVAVDASPDATGDTDAGTDAAADAEAAPLGVLVVEDQVVAAPYQTVVIKVATLPPGFSSPGKVRILNDNAGLPGTLAGEAAVPQSKVNEDLAVVLKAPVVAEQRFHVELLTPDGKPVPGADGAPLVATFKATGDTVEPVLTLTSQSLPANDLQTLSVSFVRVPNRFTVGIWLAVYADADGKIGALLGKQKFLAGDHKDGTVPLTSNLTKGQVLHAVLREGAPGTGSWALNSPVLKDFAGQVVESEFTVDSEAFHPVLEIEDQTLADPKKVKVKRVVVPKEHFGGWLALYADDAGKPGTLVGKLYYTTGTKLDQTVSLTVPQQGEQTLHAVLYAGQKWDDAGNNIVMKAPGGGEMRLQFKVGAQSLSYIVAKPYTTDNPRHVMVTRAYSYDKPAWVILARDDNGKPGMELARKKILPKFAGNVHLWSLTGDFLQSGTVAEYLQGKPGTFRRYVKGDEKLHVLLHEDFPSDNAFTYSPGGSEDVPVLDANGKAVTALLDVTVKASVQNLQKESPRYYLPCPLSQHISNATKLPVDCRCHVDIVGLDFPECKADIADFLGMQYGDGPRARTHNFGGFHSGFAEPTELIALMTWKDHQTVWPENSVTIDVGAVMGIDVQNRNRRVIGGRYRDSGGVIQTIGTGPVLSYPFEVQKGPDGKYYVASYAYVRIGASLVPTVDVIRMDPATGDRTFVWRSNHLGINLDKQANPYGHCGNGRTEKYGYESVQIGRKAFGIDDQGNFYFSYAHNGNTPTSDGIGILKVGADGKTCDFVTRTKVGAENVLYKGQTIGKGYEPQAGPYKGMLVKGGKLYTSTELNDELVEVDIATGDRKLLHKEGVNDNNTGSTGTHVLWDPYRSLIWQAGLSGATLMYDPAKGTTEPLWCAQNDRNYMDIACLKPAAWGNNGMPLERGMWMHPSDKEYLFVVNYTMIQRVHLTSGTSEIFSY